MIIISRVKDFEIYVKDLLCSNDVMAMKDIKQHSSVNCLEHSLFVSYVSYRICFFFGWDFIAAARGGLLHDLFLYNQHKRENYEGIHLRTHPKTALKNANKICELSEIEKDVILKHMWPLTFKLPKYKESLVVNITDTMCAILEMLHIYKLFNIKIKLNNLAITYT